MKQRLIAFALVLFISLGLVSSVSAQGDYYFSVDQEIVHVYWNADGSVSLNYTLVFTNQPGAHDIDFVDVGMPNSSFEMSTVSADVNGAPVNVSTGDYQGSGSGFAVVMGNQAIRSGQSGTVNVHVGRITNMVYEDSEDANYASGEFSPMWFGSQYVTGNTIMSVTFHLPPGIQTEEPRYHIPKNWPGADEPIAGLDQDGRVTYTWDGVANAYSQYTFGASFPRTYVPASVIQTEPTFSFPNIDFDTLFSLGCCGIFALIFFGGPTLGIVQAQRRKMKYLPPKIAIEGHGIKRGLTAVEAAILMEQSLDKVMTMILFGVIKKEAAEVVKRDPLTLKLSDPQPAGLHEYEKNFLKAFAPEANAKQRRTDLQDMTVKVIKSVSEKMKGFSRKESIDYYKSIMERAWQQITAADTPEVQSKLFDEAMEWTMLDKDYDGRAQRTFTRPIYVPMWWGRYDPGFGGSTSGKAGSARPISVGSATPGSRPSGLPGADFAASVVGGVQTFSQKVIGNVGDFTGKVTNVTNPPPKPSSSSGRSSGGGGGCACACACAGCACACAGGGR